MKPVDRDDEAEPRDPERYENHVRAAVERGLADLEAGRTLSTDEVIVRLHEQRRTRTGG